MPDTPQETEAAIVRCPECNSELQRCEDPHGVSWQCYWHDCLSTFDDDEIHDRKEGNGHS